ncbi:hypothetical protein [Streptomyces ureilyticus]|uniref:Uncharacterized protein n=1 Tax=Streptomyces ureilyticus TaxID=1775131 RepID=A0ABX0DUJ8_9ACTN|nr:hypothetical protein [Streptomyces ureilyticus]NGO44970.1 hypothetical protein [Streptomyces ureilyticus]
MEAVSPSYKGHRDSADAPQRELLAEPASAGLLDQRGPSAQAESAAPEPARWTVAPGGISGR